MRILPYVILVATGGLVVSQTEPIKAIPAMEWVIQGGSFGVLVYVIFHLLKYTIPGMQKQLDRAREEFRDMLDKINQRHERWEKVRHDDSTQLNTTLNSMAKVCARVHDIATEGQEED